jgi:prevent-host-death family protein
MSAHSVTEAKNRLSQLIERALQGDEIEVIGS